MRSAVYNVVAAGFLLLLTLASAAGKAISIDPAAHLLPDRLGDFRSLGVASIPNPMLISEFTFSFNSAASRHYVAKNGKKFWLSVVTTPSNSAAYAVFTGLKHSAEQAGKVERAEVGTASYQQSDRLVFVRGTSLVIVAADVARAGERQSLAEIANAFANTLDKGEGDIPVLIKHLPEWESVREQVLFAIDREALKVAVKNQPILDALSFDGGAEAAVAEYDGARMVLIEFNTPQIAGDNDQRILAKLAELRSQAQPAPTAYRRVGNYAVFVFDSPTQEAANHLIDQVKYQQLVQWLGVNPYRYDEAVREFTETTLGVFVSVVKASGLALLSTFALGGLLGTLLFTRRRAQQRAREAFTDAGGMLRLNLDGISRRSDSARLLGPGS